MTVDLVDDTGHFPARFTNGAGCVDLVPGAHVRVRGRVTRWRGELVLSDPEYTVLEGDPGGPGRE